MRRRGYEGVIVSVVGVLAMPIVVQKYEESLTIKTKTTTHIALVNKACMEMHSVKSTPFDPIKYRLLVRGRLQYGRSYKCLPKTVDADLRREGRMKGEAKDEAVGTPP